MRGTLGGTLGSDLVPSYWDDPISSRALSKDRKSLRTRSSVVNLLENDRVRFGTLSGRDNPRIGASSAFVAAVRALAN
jgi:hypothetical protein